MKEESITPRYEIGKRIRQIREDRGLSRRQLAEQIGGSVSRVSNWEQGLNRPDADMIAVLCTVLQVPPSELFDVNLNEDDFTSEEREIVKAYRGKPELQHAVRVLLGIDTTTK